MKGDLEFSALTQATETRKPACTDDPRFIDDDPTPGDRIEMTELCTLCPLLAHCKAYAEVGRPAAGWWAGQLRTPRSK